MIFAVIKNGVVINTIVADQAFVDSVSSDYGACVRIDQLDPVPGMGWTYVDGVFAPPEE